MSAVSVHIRRALFVATFLLLCAGATVWLTPHTLLVNLRHARVSLESAVPAAFGEWRLDTAGSGGVVNPQTQDELARIYDQVLSRTYVNAQGQRVMLSIAYGADQRRRAGLQLHQPEVCYPAQGFELVGRADGYLQVGAASLPVKRLETILQRQRYEPVTYWIMTGEYPNVGGVDRRQIYLKYGLERVVPDGLLFRVSSIGANTAQQYELQSRFVNDLLAQVTPESRHLLAGL